MRTEQEIKERIKSFKKDIIKYEKQKAEAVVVSLRYMVGELEWVLGK